MPDRVETVSDRLNIRAELMGGPLDGQVMDVDGVPDLLRLPLSSGLPGDYDALELGLQDEPAVAIYVLVERDVVVTGDPFLPRRTVGGKYQYWV